MKICVAGDGAWGTALAVNAVQNKHEVVIWGAFPEYLEEMRKTRENSKFLPGVKLPETLSFESDISKALAGSSIIICATPTQFLRSVLQKMAQRGITLGNWC